jgi:hypothetical protein
VENLPRLSSIAGVARALMATVGVDEAVAILVTQFGWDVAFNALAKIDSQQATRALFRCVSHLVRDDLAT